MIFKVESNVILPAKFWTLRTRFGFFDRHLGLVFSFHEWSCLFAPIPCVRIALNESQMRVAWRTTSRWSLQMQMPWWNTYAGVNGVWQVEAGHVCTTYRFTSLLKTLAGKRRFLVDFELKLSNGMFLDVSSCIACSIPTILLISNTRCWGKNYAWSGDCFQPI